MQGYSKDVNHLTLMILTTGTFLFSDYLPEQEDYDKTWLGRLISFTHTEHVHLYSRPHGPRSFWSAPRITTSGQVQWDSGSDWLCKHSRMRPEPIRFVRLDSEHAQSDGKFVNRGLPVFELARGRDSWCWPKRARPLGTRMVHLELCVLSLTI